MNWSKIWWISYSLIVFTRVLSFRIRLRIPTLRGSDTFLGLKIPPDFYSGPGRRLMRSYYTGIILPPLLEAFVLAPVMRWGQPGWIMATIFATSITLAFVGRWNVKRLCLAAKPYAVEGAEPATTVSLQFETRSLNNYRSWPIELSVWAFDLSAVFLIADSVRLAMGIEKTAVHSTVSFLLHLSGLIKDDAVSARFSSWLFWPLLLIYIQVGALLMKYAVVAWPLRMSADTTEESRNYRNNVRRYLIRSCDWIRLVFSLALLTASIELRFPEIAKGGRWQWFGYSLHVAVVVLILVWYQINARRLVQQAHQLKLSRTIPRARIAPDPSRFRLGGLAYYDPDSPSVLIPSRAGYALNFADRRAYITVAYVGGLLLLALIHLRFGWG